MKICSVPDCKKKHMAKGFCQKHLWHFNKYGDPLHYTNERQGICEVLDCENKAKSKGLCINHHSLFRNNGDPLTKRQDRHGLSKTREYGIWSGIKARCYNKKMQNYPYYGGKGIKVCDRWKNSVVAFYEDMGPRPGDNYEIDRLDSNKNYEPDNCQWLEKIENTRKSTAAKITMEIAENIRQIYKSGEKKQKEIAEIYGISISTISHIINNRLWVNL